MPYTAPMAFLWSALTEGHGSVGATIAACGVAANWAAGLLSHASELHAKHVPQGAL